MTRAYQNEGEQAKSGVTDVVVQLLWGLRNLALGNHDALRCQLKLNLIHSIATNIEEKHLMPDRIGVIRDTRLVAFCTEGNSVTG